MNFRERFGFKKREIMQIDSLDSKTKNLLFNLISKIVNIEIEEQYNSFIESTFYRDNYNRIFINNKTSLDISKLLNEKLYPGNECKFDIINIIFDKYDYSYIYSFLEIIYKHIDSYIKKELKNGINNILEKEKCNYRMGKDGLFIKVSNENDLENITSALKIKSKTTREHLNSAIAEYSKRDNNINYNTVCSECTCAIESFAKSILDNKYKRYTLNKLIKPLREKLNIPSFITISIEEIWDFVNEHNIRHGQGDNTKVIDITEKEAYYILMTCSSFINYINKSV